MGFYGDHYHNQCTFMIFLVLIFLVFICCCGHYNSCSESN